MNAINTIEDYINNSTNYWVVLIWNVFTFESCGLYFGIFDIINYNLIKKAGKSSKSFVVSELGENSVK